MLTVPSVNEHSQGSLQKQPPANVPMKTKTQESIAQDLLALVGHLTPDANTNDARKSALLSRYELSMRLLNRYYYDAELCPFL